MTVVRRCHHQLTVACDLDRGDLATRIGAWQALRDAHGLGAETVPGGARLWLSAGATPTAVDLVEREARCCGFLDLELSTEGDRVRLDITSPSPEGAQVAAFLAGLDPGPARAPS